MVVLRMDLKSHPFWRNCKAEIARHLGVSRHLWENISLKLATATSILQQRYPDLTTPALGDHVRALIDHERDLEALLILAYIMEEGAAGKAYHLIAAEIAEGKHREGNPGKPPSS